MCSTSNGLCPVWYAVSMQSSYSILTRLLQSWSPKNLFNLYRRSLGDKVEATDYTRTMKSLFQQRWASKQLVRAYHGDYINEKIFKRWYLPGTLPDVRPRKPAGDDLLLGKWANRNDAMEKERKRKEDEAAKGMAPVGSLMFSEVERRIDVVLFRSCFAHSVYEARRLVIHGDVLLNGKKVGFANYIPAFTRINFCTASKCKHQVSSRRHDHCEP